MNSRLTPLAVIRARGIEMVDIYPQHHAKADPGDADLATRDPVAERVPLCGRDGRRAARAASGW
jgi:hypothetical protein